MIFKSSLSGLSVTYTGEMVRVTKVDTYPKFTFFCCYLLRDELDLKKVKENFVGNLISYKKGP